MMINLNKLKKYMIALYIIISTITASTLINRIALAGMIGVCGYSFLNTSDFRYKGNITWRYLLIYGVFLLFSALYTITPSDVYAVVLYGYVSMLALVFFIIDSARSEEDVKFFIKVFILASVANCISTYMLVGSESFGMLLANEQKFRLAAEEQNSNEVGMVSIFGTIFSMYFLLYEKKTGIKKLAYVAILIITGLFGLLSGSRKAILMLFIGCCIMLYFKTINNKNAIKVFFRIMIAIVVVILLYKMISGMEMFSVINERIDGLISGLFGGNKTDRSTSERMNMIDIGWDVFMAYPFFGQGVFASYRYFLTYSHNNYIEILMNTGIIGFLIFYRPFVYNIKHLLKLDKKEPLYSVSFFVIAWLLIGAYGMVFYYSKFEMSLFAVVSCWISLKRRENSVSQNTESTETSENSISINS